MKGQFNSEQEIGVVAVIVYAKKRNAIDFYKHFGFIT
jgi:hypothetical protein